MRERVVATVTTLVVALLWRGPSLAADSGGSASLPKTANINLPYPEQIDLVQETQGWTYRLNENNLPLYMSSADKPDKSYCLGMCAKQWVPVKPDGSAKSPVGDWTIITRQDGTQQWAFKHHPVYTPANSTPATSTPNKPAADTGTFHLMAHFR